MRTVLYILTDPHEAEGPIQAGDCAGKQVLFLDVTNQGEQIEIPSDWQRLDTSQFVDPAEFRRDFLAFVDDWPRQPLCNGKSFDDLFRLSGNHSLWWTTVGSERHPHKEPVRDLLKLWIVDRVLKDRSPHEVVLNCRHPKLEAALFSRCEHETVLCRSVSDVRQRTVDSPVGWSWFLAQLRGLATHPFKVGVIALLVRLFSRTSRETRREREKSAVVFASKMTRNVRREGGKPRVWIWQEICAQLKDEAPSVRRRFLLHRDMKGSRSQLVRWLRASGAKLLDEMEGALPLRDGYPALGAWCAALPRQIRALWRFMRLEKSGQLRRSFRFAEADVSPFFVDRLRVAVETMADWDRKVVAIGHCLRWVGNVRLVVVCSEFYPAGMLIIAAARRLGIPTIGVQHATIMSSHLIYTVPPGHVCGAPNPDFFAAYSDYAKEVASRDGAFPANRVWVAGCPRLDHWVNRPPNRTEAREQFEFSSETKIVLVATHTYPWFPEAVRAILEATRNRSDCLVCVKLHPGDQRLELYQEMAKDRHGTVQFFEQDFDRLLAASDLLISSSSTTMLEACLLNVPTICANFSNEPDRYPYVEDGASLPARSTQQMREALDQILNEEGAMTAAERRLEFLKRHAGPTANGLGSATIARHIHETVQEEMRPLEVVSEQPVAAFCMPRKT